MAAPALKLEDPKLLGALDTLLGSIEAQLQESGPRIDLSDSARRREVLENCGAIIGASLKPPLKPYETFLLSASAAVIEAGSISNARKPRRTRRHRMDEATDCCAFVENKVKGRAIEPGDALFLLEMCRAHFMPDLNYLHNKAFSRAGHGEVRLPLLSAILRLADALALRSGQMPSVIADTTRPNRVLLAKDLHKSITDVIIDPGIRWDVQVYAIPQKPAHGRQLHSLVTWLQDELDAVSWHLRGAGLHFRKVDLIFSVSQSQLRSRKLGNPFQLLAPFDSRHADRFAGRARETQQVLEMILGRQVVVIIGESGVGKTSLVDAGVLPALREHNFRIARFSFHEHDPIEDLIQGLSALSLAPGEGAEEPGRTHDLLDQVRQHRGKGRLLIIGDHLEQMFTHDKSTVESRRRFVTDAARLLASSEPVVFLFCLREDYLAQLYQLSSEFPELYDRKNTFALHRLSRENGREVFERAGEFGVSRMSHALIEKVLDELCMGGGGLIYPPYLQIVGYRIYSSLIDRMGDVKAPEICLDDYEEKLRGAEAIIDQYLDGLLDRYSAEEKPIVAQVLGVMVTEHNTKKRVKLGDLHRALPDLPEGHDLSGVLAQLVEARIVRRSLDEFELIHDFLANKVIELIGSGRYLSPPVRRALEVIESDYSQLGFRSQTVAERAGVSRAHLAYLFREQLGTTIKRKINAVRVARAKSLLSGTDLQVADIAERVGFGNASVLGKVFREIEGNRPQSYRIGLRAQHETLEASDPLQPQQPRRARRTARRSKARGSGELDTASDLARSHSGSGFSAMEQRDGRPHVFLSYCHDNVEEVQLLREDLVAAGEPTWWDRDILGGQDWRREIRSAIRDCYAVVLCLSPELEQRVRSGVYPEVLDALSEYRSHAPGNIFLIPVRLRACRIPDIEIDDARTLDRLQAIDLFPPANRAEGLELLLKSLRAAAKRA